MYSTTICQMMEKKKKRFKIHRNEHRLNVLVYADDAMFNVFNYNTNMRLCILCRPLHCVFKNISY